MYNTTFVTENNWHTIIGVHDDEMTIKIYGKCLGEFFNLLRKKFNENFKDMSLMKYELYSFCECDINTIDIFDDSDSIVRQMKVDAYNFSLTIPPCSNKVEYYSKRNFDKLIKTDKELKKYIRKYFNHIDLIHRNTKSNESSDYFFEIELKQGFKVKFLGEHKSVMYSPYGKCSAGSTINKLITDIKEYNDDLLYKILFKVDNIYDEVQNKYIVKNVFIGNFLTRIGISSDVSTIFCSSTSAHITSEKSILSLLWNLRFNTFDEICNYIVQSYDNKLHKKREYFFINDNKEYTSYSHKRDNINYYGFAEIKRTDKNIPYINDCFNNKILLSICGTTKYKHYKGWTNISLQRPSVIKNKSKKRQKYYHTRSTYRIKYLENIKLKLLEQNQNIDISKLAGVQRVIVDRSPKIIMVSKKGNIEVGKKQWKDQYYSKHTDIAIIDNYKISA